MPEILGTYYPLRRIVFFLGEGLLIFFAISLINNGAAISVTLPDNGGGVLTGGYSRDFFLLNFWPAALATGVLQLFLYFFDLYDLEVYSSFKDTALQMTQAFGFGCITLAGFYYIFPAMVISTQNFVMGYILMCVLLAGWRFFYVLALSKRVLAQPILIFGAGDLAENIKIETADKLDSGYIVKAIVGPDKPAFSHEGIPYIGNGNLKALCRKHQVERIVVAPEDRRGVLPVRDLINCKLDGVDITQGINFYEDLTGKLMVQKVNPDWIIYAKGFSVGRFTNFIKRLSDILLSVLGLIAAVPIMVFSFIIIKLESTGPVIYRQERVGFKGRTFEVLKFRSMGVDAEKGGAVWAKKNDARVTRYGGFIRKVRIDEVPQLWNILKGDMSFVGPRPERPMFVEQLSEGIPYYSLRHNVKPGLTGWAQIRYPYGASEEDALRKLEFDLYYLKHLSFAFDLSIIFQTVKTVLFKKGAR